MNRYAIQSMSSSAQLFMTLSKNSNAAQWMRYNVQLSMNNNAALNLNKFVTQSLNSSVTQ